MKTPNIQSIYLIVLLGKKKPRDSEAFSGLLILFFYLFVRSRLSAPFAELLEFDLFGDEFLILARPIVGAAALRTGEFYELVLGHTGGLYLT